MFSTKSKYEENAKGKFDIYIKGFNYKTMTPTFGFDEFNGMRFPVLKWNKIVTVDTEDEAKEMVKNVIPSNED